MRFLFARSDALNYKQLGGCDPLTQLQKGESTYGDVVDYMVTTTKEIVVNSVVPAQHHLEFAESVVLQISLPAFLRVAQSPPVANRKRVFPNLDVPYLVNQSLL